MEPIVPPAATPRKSFHRIAQMLLALLMVSVLASCATGNKREASFYESRDATVQSQMPEVQATTTARFFGGTPTAIATYPPVPALAELTLATSVGGDGSPQNRVKNASGGTALCLGPDSQHRCRRGIYGGLGTSRRHGD